MRLLLEPASEATQRPAENQAEQVKDAVKFHFFNPISSWNRPPITIYSTFLSKISLNLPQPYHPGLQRVKRCLPV
jgi:hypothetical protein